MVLAEQGNYSPPHISLLLLGRFKARSWEEQRRIIDIYYETKCGIQPGIWAQIFIVALEDCSIKQVWGYQR